MTDECNHRDVIRFRVLIAVCAIQFALLIALSILWNSKEQQPIAFKPRVYSLTNQEPYFLGNPGPWGDIEFMRIDIEPPDEFVLVDGDFEPTRWFFEYHTPDELTAFFRSCDISETQASELLNATNWMVETNGIVVSPGNDLILNLPPAARARIYSELSRSERNEFQSSPYTYRNGGFDDWLRGAKLSAQTISLLKRLVYQRGNSMCFSDMPQLFAQIPTLEEKRALVKALSRNSTLLIKLRIRPQTDIAAVSGYWEKGGRSKDIVPLLDSLTKIPGSATVDIVHLLPPFARKRINTYPQLQTDPGKPMPNCFWTTMNFYNDPADDRYYDNSVWVEELKTNYVLVTQPTFGDFIFLARPDNFPIHAAVYIADDVVFTKNGSSESQPWVLMKLQDLLARYPKDYTISMVFFRKQPADK